MLNVCKWHGIPKPILYGIDSEDKKKIFKVAEFVLHLLKL